MGPVLTPPGSGAPLLCPTALSVEELEQRSPARVHFSIRGECGIVHLCSKGREAPGREGGQVATAPKPAGDARHPYPAGSRTPFSTSIGTTPAWIPLTRPDRARLLSVARRWGDTFSHPRRSLSLSPCTPWIHSERQSAGLTHLCWSSGGATARRCPGTVKR